MLKISHKVLLGDFDAFDEVMHKDVTDSEFFIWILFFFCTLLMMIIMLNLLTCFVHNLVKCIEIAYDNTL